jgi:hypothetical protein
MFGAWPTRPPVVDRSQVDAVRSSFETLLQRITYVTEASVSGSRTTPTTMSQKLSGGAPSSLAMRNHNAGTTGIANTSMDTATSHHRAGAPTRGVARRPRHQRIATGQRRTSRGTAKTISGEMTTNRDNPISPYR